MMRARWLECNRPICVSITGHTCGSKRSIYSRKNATLHPYLFAQLIFDSPIHVPSSLPSTRANCLASRASIHPASTKLFSRPKQFLGPTPKGMYSYWVGLMDFQRCGSK
jgi:hypothetical protein